MSKFGSPLSAIVGTSGNDGVRFLPELPSATSLPARMCGPDSMGTEK